MSQKQSFTNITNEYDPKKPNSYSEFLKLRAIREYNENQSHMAQSGSTTKRLYEESNLDQYKQENQERLAQIMPAWLQKKNEANKTASSDHKTTAATVQQQTTKISVAKSQPLPSTTTTSKPQYLKIHEHFSKQPTCILLLKNYTDPYQEKLSIQCDIIKIFSKYGNVRKCIIKEVTENVAPEEKNRIFIEYGTVSEAQRAYNELNDQYINDNELHLYFYEDGKYRRSDFLPDFE